MLKSRFLYYLFSDLKYTKTEKTLFSPVQTLLKIWFFWLYHCKKSDFLFPDVDSDGEKWKWTKKNIFVFLVRLFFLTQRSSKTLFLPMPTFLKIWFVWLSHCKKSDFLFPDVDSDRKKWKWTKKDFCFLLVRLFLLTQRSSKTLFWPMPTFLKIWFFFTFSL